LPHFTSSALAIWHLLRHHDVVALALLLFVEEVGVPLPLPGNVLLMYFGMQITHGQVGAAEVVAAMTVASALGSICLYAIAAQLGRRAVLRWGRYVGLDNKRVARIEAWLDRYGAVTIFLGRIAPGLRTPTSAVGGIFGIPLPKFIPFTSLAALVWTGFWISLGAMVGRRLHLEEMMTGSHRAGPLILAAACLLILPTIGVISARRQERAERVAADHGTTEPEHEPLNAHSGPDRASGPSDRQESHHDAARQGVSLRR